MNIHLSGGAIALLTLVVSPSALAATQDVGPTCTHATVGAAVAAAGNGDIIAIETGAYTENISGITVDDLHFMPATSCLPDPSAGAPVINGSGSQILEFLGTTTTIERIIFTGGGGTDGGCILQNQGFLTLLDTTFIGCSASNLGGAVAVLDATATVEDSAFSFNSASVGGALYVGGAGGAAIQNGNVFQNNTATWGGAMAIRSDAVVSVQTIGSGPATVFQNNDADDGGAIFIDDFGQAAAPTLTVRGTLDHPIDFIDNEAIASGGAISEGQIFNLASSTPNSIELTRARFHGNVAGTDGGAVSLVDAGDDVLAVINSRFVENDAADDGGAIAMGGEATVVTTNSRFLRNTADEGGAIHGSAGPGGSLTMRVDYEGCTTNNLPSTGCSEVRDNTGEAVVMQTGSLLIENTLFAGNTADNGVSSGGAALRIDGDAAGTLTNVLAFGNGVAGQSDPAVVVTGSATLDIESSTFANNARRSVVFDDTDGSFVQSISKLNGQQLLLTAASAVELRCSNLGYVGTASVAVDLQNDGTSLFVDQANDDYRLPAASPSRNACPIATYTDHRPDIAGRPVVGDPDQGAIERQAP